MASKTTIGQTVFAIEARTLINVRPTYRHPLWNTLRESTNTHFDGVGDSYLYRRLVINRTKNRIYRNRARTYWTTTDGYYDCYVSNRSIS